jgi:hypothetical protein
VSTVLKASPAKSALLSVLLAAALLLGGASGAQAAGGPAARSLAPGAARAYIAHPVQPLPVFRRAGGGTVRWRTPVQTEWGAEPVSLLALSSTTVRGTLWLRVRLPIRPNTAAGWVNANYVQLSSTRWRVVVHTSARWVDVYRSGRYVRGFQAVVGRPSMPTPHGLFAVWEKIAEPDPTGFIGPWALHLTAHSNVLFNFGGGPGRVAIHGRDGLSLLDPLGTADSHGCIRVLNSDIDWLASVLPDGAPVLVTN